MSCPPIFAIAETSAGWFGASAWPLPRSLLFADRHRGGSREGNKYGKRKFLRLDSQLSHHSEILPLFGLRQNQERRPFLLGSTRSSGPMDIRIRIGRQLIVNHLGHILNIEASGCDISRHERPESAGSKGTERPFPLRLAVIAG
jgi:hypothetical protein